MAPAPKLHDQVTPVEVPVLVKLTGKLLHCGAVEVKLATGVLLMFIVSITVAEQLAFEIVNVTVLAPDESYSTPPGFWDEEVPGVAFGPKSQV